MRKENLLWAILMCGMALSSCTDRLQEAASISLNPKIKSETGFKASLNLENSFISTRSTEPTPIYPDYYGGGYISDNDELVVLVKKGYDKENAKIEFQSRSKSSNILIKECDYSFNELMDLNTKLGNVFCSNNNLVKDLGWFSVGLLPIENRISVCLFDCSENNIQRFKSEVSDSPMIIFEEISNINYDTEIQEVTDSIAIKEKATSMTNVHAGSQINRIGKATNNKGEIIDAILNGSEYGSILVSFVKQNSKISDLKEVAEEVSKEDIVLSDLEKNKVLERSKKVDSEIVSKFESLIAAWKNEINTNPKTMFSSSTLDYKQLPQFKSLQEMGSVIIPLIMEKLLDEENFFMLPLYDTLQLDSNLKIVYNKNDRKCLEGEQNRARRTVRMWVNSL